MIQGIQGAQTSEGQGIGVLGDPGIVGKLGISKMNAKEALK